MATSGGSFSDPGATSSGTCGLSLALPKWVLGVSLPGLPIQFPPKFPPFSLSGFFKLSCDPTKPVSVTNNVPWGGGRTANNPPDPDDSEDSPTF
jgi:hypothetical protein